MMRVATTAFAVLSLLLRTHAASAQPAPLGGRALSLADAISLAQERAPRVGLGRSGVREAEARAVGAGVVMPLNPRITSDLRPPITGVAGGTGAGWRDIGYSFVGEMFFDVGGAPGARVREAGHAVQTASASLAVARLDARAQAWIAYVRAKVADMRLEETRASGQLAQRVLDATRLRGEVGAAGDIEQTTATLELARLSAA